MRTRRKWPLAIAAGLALGISLMVLLPVLKRPPEPYYQGRPLSDWLADYRRPERNGGVPTAAELAVRAIGTNALPCLLNWIRYEPSLWREALLAIATRPVEGKTSGEGSIVYGRSFIRGRSARLAELAEHGFIILTTNAALVMPNLEALMKESRNPEVRLRAIYALGEIGPIALPTLVDALNDSRQPNRCEIIYSIYGVERNSPRGARDAVRMVCVPALAALLNNPDQEMRRQSATTLYNLTNSTELVHLSYGTP